MTDFVELKGRINEQGQLEVLGDLPENMRGDVIVTIETVEAADLEAEDAVWDAFFESNSDEFDKLAQKAHEDYLAGKAKRLDTEKDFDPQDVQ